MYRRQASPARRSLLAHVAVPCSRGASILLSGGRHDFGAVGRVLSLKLLAPALDFGVVENLADHATQEALKVRILQATQGADGFFLVGLVQVTGAFVSLQLGIKQFDL